MTPPNADAIAEAWTILLSALDATTAGKVRDKMGIGTRYWEDLARQRGKIIEVQHTQLRLLQTVIETEIIGPNAARFISDLQRRDLQNR